MIRLKNTHRFRFQYSLFSKPPEKKIYFFNPLQHSGIHKAYRAINRHLSLPRKDVRHLYFVTIDSDNTKNYEDAVYFEKNDDEYLLFVAITDKTQKNKKEVSEVRSFSLLHKAERPVIICELTFNTDKKLISQSVYLGTICSKANLTYDEVNNLLQDSPHLHKKLCYFDSLSEFSKFIQYRNNTSIAHLMIREAMVRAKKCIKDYLKEALTNSIKKKKTQEKIHKKMDRLAQSDSKPSKTAEFHSFFSPSAAAFNSVKNRTSQKKNEPPEMQEYKKSISGV